MDKFIGSKRLVIFSQKFIVVSGIPRLLAEGCLNLFEPEASREAEGELFRHRNNRKTFDVKKMTQEQEAINLSISDPSEKNKFVPYNARSIFLTTP